MESKMKPFKDKENLTYLGILAFFGFLSFMQNPTAYTWGEQDMMPFFERVFDSNFLVNDFFTNTTTEKNPRWVYGYFVVALSWITSLSWYKILYVLKLILCIVNPILYYKVIVALLRRYVDKISLSKLSPIVLCAVVLMVVMNSFRDFFVIAAWLNYTNAIQANSIALIFCFMAILFKERGARSLTFLIFFFLACLMHPAVGFFGILFYIIFLLPKYKKEKKDIALIFLTGILGMLCIKIAFAASSELSTSEFIRYYVVERHPWHYHVPYYEIENKDWRQYFTYINILFALPFFYGLFKRKSNLMFLALVSWVSYSGAIAMQYVFIDLYPVKMVAYLGVSRFTSFGYWMLLILWGILLADFITKEKEFVFPSLGIKNFGLIILNLIFVGILFIDNPKETNYLNKKDFYDFVRSTPNDAIFSTYSTKLSVDMRIVGERGVLVGLEFPFTETAIVDFSNRFSSLYGSRQQSINGTSFYRNLTTKDFVAISKKYQLDYIVSESKFSDNFGANIPVWKNSKLRIYEVKTLDLNL